MNFTAAVDSLFHGDDSPYTIKVDKFEGPLDLLLHLIKKNEVDIYDIPISIITREYLEHVRLMKDLNLDVAGEFLVMAATLIQIKSKLLIPQVHDDEAADEDETDPRAELVRRLLEYQTYKEAAAQLSAREVLGREVFARKFRSFDLDAAEEPEAPLELELYQLVEGFTAVLSRLPEETYHQVMAETINITDRINEILSLLTEQDIIVFHELFPEEVTREFVVATFLAMLELCKLKAVKVMQRDRYEPIWIMPAATGGDADGAEAA